MHYNGTSYSSGSLRCTQVLGHLQFTSLSCPARLKLIKHARLRRGELQNRHRTYLEGRVSTPVFQHEIQGQHHLVNYHFAIENGQIVDLAIKNGDFPEFFCKCLPQGTTKYRAAINRLCRFHDIACQGGDREVPGAMKRWCDGADTG